MSNKSGQIQGRCASEANIISLLVDWIRGDLSNKHFKYHVTVNSSVTACSTGDTTCLIV